MGPFTEMPYEAESFLFHAIMPGLDEELLFRGFLLWQLVRALYSTQRSEEAKAWRDRWLTVTISLLFGLGHGLMFTNGFELTFDIASVVFTGLLGAAFMEIRLRWDSLLPAVLAHNAWNSSIAVANAGSARWCFGARISHLNGLLSTGSQAYTGSRRNSCDKWSR